MKIKSQNFYEKEKLLRKETNKEYLPLPAQPQIKGRATVPYSRKEGPSWLPPAQVKPFSQDLGCHKVAGAIIHELHCGKIISFPWI